MSVEPRDYSANTLGTAFLAIASGSSDVIAFLVLGHVFASAMTGNTALLGIALSQGDWLAASQPFTALIGFVIGAAVASMIYNPNVASKAPTTRQSTILRVLLLLEIACLAGFAILWQNTSQPPEGAVLYCLILLCSLGMGIQGIAAKRINVPGINTIVFTSTVVSIVFSVTEILLGRKDDQAFRGATMRQIMIFGAYGLGAILAGLLDWSNFTLLTFMPVTAALLALLCYELPHAKSR